MQVHSKHSTHDIEAQYRNEIAYINIYMCVCVCVSVLFLYQFNYPYRHHDS